MGVRCSEVWLEICEHVDGELGAARRAEIELHAASCGRCAALVAGTRNVIQLYGDERMRGVPATLHGGVRRVISAHLESRRGPAWGLVLSAVMAGAMVLLVVTAKPHPAGAAAALSPMSQPAVRALPQTVEIARPGRLFHVKGCPYIHGRAEAVSLDAALRAGMAPCARCLGEYLAHPITEHESVESADYLEDGSW